MLASVGYFADNLNMPSVAVNSLAQGKLRQTGVALLRFVINSTVGFGGLADPATVMSVAMTSTRAGPPDSSGVRDKLACNATSLP